MATQDYWAEPPISREQIILFAPSLDNMIADDENVRLVDEFMRGRDWNAWKAHYNGQRGQPPIHPQVMASAILYGLCRGIRSSRKLEYACRYNLDFIWLVEGRTIDHTTFAKFRTEFKAEIKDLFRQIGRVALSFGLARLGEVGFDGTRVKANNSRHATRTAATLEEKLAALDEQVDKMLLEAEAADAAEAKLFESNESATKLPPELADLKQRQQKLRQALERAQAADASRRKDGINPAENPAQVPTTDPDSRVMPNKEGGYAANYTPTAATESRCGFIMDADVTSDVNESSVLLQSVDRIEQNFDAKPEKLLTDGGNNSGHLLAGLEERGIESYAPVESNLPQPGNPALRDDVKQPVPPSEYSQLPRNSQGQLDKSCFVYDESLDEYRCPQGHALPYSNTKQVTRGGAKVTLRVYQCASCADCPLASVCLSKNALHGRTIRRDPHEAVRERVATRMKTEAACELYNQRSHISETPFGILKQVFGLRQFLLRGLEKVQTEWTWAVTAFNLLKLVREFARLRAKWATLAGVVAK